jgi:hypothetical protein
MTKIRRMGEGTLLIIDKPPSPFTILFFLKSLFHIFKVNLKLFFSPKILCSEIFRIPYIQIVVSNIIFWLFGKPIIQEKKN